MRFNTNQQGTTMPCARRLRPFLPLHGRNPRVYYMSCVLFTSCVRPVLPCVRCVGPPPVAYAVRMHHVARPPSPCIHCVDCWRSVSCTCAPDAMAPECLQSLGCCVVRCSWCKHTAATSIKPNPGATFFIFRNILNKPPNPTCAHYEIKRTIPNYATYQE